MLTEDKFTALQTVVSGASKEELIWMNGYLTGLLGIQDKGLDTPTTQHNPAPSVGKLSILFATETGNTKSLSGKFNACARQQNVGAKVTDIAQYKHTALSKEENVIIIISTQGEGEPPLSAQKFFTYLKEEKPDLSHIHFGIVALGDNSYPLFCQAGEDLNILFQSLGAHEIIPITKCDTDYEQQALSWFQEALKQLSGGNRETKKITVKSDSGKKYFKGIVTTNINLNDIGSNKSTHHIELEAEGVSYKPGDAISVIPHNPDHEIKKILEITNWDANDIILHKDKELPLHHLLKEKVNISWLPERVVNKYAGIVKQNIPDTRISFIDLLKIYPLAKDHELQDIISILEPISPRQYSIASSSALYEGEVHLTIAKDKFYVDDDIRYGLCSDYLIRKKIGETIEFSIHTNNRFRLPEDDKDIIMVGPGTGIAPFRAFLQEREASMASGKNWLFFGDQHFTTDFLYQTEIQDWKSGGMLTNFNAAFSRDQPEKVYVQHKMKEHGKELFEWLDHGAYFYICGTKSPMSEDVDMALKEIIQQYGHYTLEEAEQYISKLGEEERYLKDVY